MPPNIYDIRDTKPKKKKKKKKPPNDSKDQQKRQHFSSNEYNFNTADPSTMKNSLENKTRRSWGVRVTDWYEMYYSMRGGYSEA